MSPYFALSTVENNKNKKSVKFQGDMLNFCDFIQVFVFTRNHHLKMTMDFEFDRKSSEMKHARPTEYVLIYLIALRFSGINVKMTCLTFERIQ